MAQPQAGRASPSRRAIPDSRGNLRPCGDAAHRRSGAKERQALMSTAVFIDTNVLLYAYDRADPTKNARAREWVARLWHDRHGRTSMQVLSEYYVNLTRKFRVPAEAAWDDAASFFAWRPQPIDESLLRRAREVSRRYQISWWDSLIVAAAQLQDCLVLLTEDLQDGMVFGTLAVRSPFSAVLEEAPAAYEVARAAPLHRPRGRPKRIAA
ncbi:MAG: PIN domain-containing protein [Betaproteobacteria bacterium]|nr:MAG: PIN domain-containing protein [Betaproteobacteria bacterium]TMH42896.1 MAG: PIN domain-containing protein [Betaproteobacteria bacterium]